MRTSRVTKGVLLVTLLIVMSAGAFLAIAEEDYTAECDICHTNTTVLTLTSNATGTVNAKLGVPFTLVVDAAGYDRGDRGFTISIYSLWADNDQFTFTEGYTTDGDAADQNPQMRSITAEYQFTPLAVGDFTIRIWTAGKIDLSKSLDVDVSVTVDDSVKPLIDSPADLEFEEGDSSASITWTPTDTNPSTYEILDNSTILESGAWDGSPIAVDVESLSVGYHIVTLTVFDLGGNNVSDQVQVIVKQAASTTSTSGPTGPEGPAMAPLSPEAMVQWGVVGASWIGGFVVFLVAYEVILRRGRKY